MGSSPELAETLKAEYAEIGQWCRHDDAMGYQAGTILLPLAFGAVAAAVRFPDAQWVLFIASIALYLYYLGITHRLSWYSQVRLDRAAEIERALRMRHHRGIRKREKTERFLKRGMPVRRLRFGGLVILFFAWAVVLLPRLLTGVFP